MLQLLLLPVLLAPALASAAPPPLDRKAELRCVATLALVAYDQQRSAPGWDGFPDLTRRGAHFAGVVQRRLSPALSEDGYRKAVRAEIEALQAEAVKADDPELLAHGAARECMALADAIDPPPVEPSTARCAALSAIAYQDMKAKVGETNEATAMMVLASVLDSEARKEWRTAGKTEAENDVLMGVEREAVAKTSPDDAEAVYRNGEELKLCMASVRPQLEKKPH